MRRELVAGGTVAVLFGCSTASGDNGDYEKQEDLTLEVVSCEEGFARLAECCPGFEAREDSCQDYRYQRTSTCNGSTYVHRGGTRPALSLSESQCIRATSCSELVERKICEFYQTSIDTTLDRQRTTVCS